MRKKNLMINHGIRKSILNAWRVLYFEGYFILHLFIIYNLYYITIYY